LKKLRELNFKSLEYKSEINLRRKVATNLEEYVYILKILETFIPNFSH